MAFGRQPPYEWHGSGPAGRSGERLVFEHGVRLMLFRLMSVRATRAAGVRGLIVSWQARMRPAAELLPFPSSKQPLEISPDQQLSRYQYPKFEEVCHSGFAVRRGTGARCTLHSDPCRLVWQVNKIRS